MHELCIQHRKLVETRSLYDVLRNESYITVLKTKTKKQRWDIFFSMEHRLLVAKEPLFWIFRVWKIRSFLSQEVDGNMVFIDYWKVLVLDFSGMGNTVFFLRQKGNEKMIFTDSWNVHVLTFSGKKNTVFFEARSCRKDDIYQLMQNSCFEPFRDGKCGLFWDKKLIERLYLLITEKLMFWSTEKFLFWAFRSWEYGLFFSQKVDVKVIFAWSFWAFHDIPEPGKYGFSCSGVCWRFFWHIWYYPNKYYILSKKR